MESTFFCSTLYLEIDNKYQVGPLDLVYDISREDLLHFITYPEDWDKPGLIFKEMLVEKPFFTRQTEFKGNEECLREFTFYGDSIIQLFNALWLVKDCSCNANGRTIICDNGLVYTNPANTTFTNAEGSFESLFFSKDELRQATEYHKKIWDLTKTLSGPKSKLQLGLNSNWGNTAPYNEQNRIVRAIIFLHQARQDGHLPTKISYHVLLLECLFSANDPGEIQHKVGERIAFYIGETPAERRAIFSDFKEYYKVRSSYFHGQELNKAHNTHEKLVPISKKIDILVRRVLIKIFDNDTDNFLLTGDDLREYFNGMLFGQVI